MNVFSSKMGTTYAQLDIARFVILHSVSRSDGVFAIDHLDECVTLVDVDDACLDHTIHREQRAQVGLG